jgi:hypothetical protein
VLAVPVGREKHPGLYIDEKGGYFNEVFCNLEVQLGHKVNILEKSFSNGGEGNVPYAYLIFFDERNKDSQWSLVAFHLDFQAGKQKVHTMIP